MVQLLYVLLSLVYGITLLVCMGDWIDYVTGSSSFLIHLFGWLAVFLVWMLPGGQFAILAGLWYYLTFVADWNAFLALLLVAPGLTILLVTLFSGAILGAITEKRGGLRREAAPRHVAPRDDDIIEGDDDPTDPKDPPRLLK